MLQLKQPNLIYYLCTISNRGQTWFIVKAFDYPKLRLLQGKIRAKQGYNIQNFAEVLYAGYDDHAPQEVLDAVNAEYGTGFSN